MLIRIAKPSVDKWECLKKYVELKLASENIVKTELKEKVES